MSWTFSTQTGGGLIIWVTGTLLSTVLDKLVFHEQLVCHQPICPGESVSLWRNSFRSDLHQDDISLISKLSGLWQQMGFMTRTDVKCYNGITNHSYMTSTAMYLPHSNCFHPRLCQTSTRVGFLLNLQIRSKVQNSLEIICLLRKIKKSWYLECIWWENF